MLSKRFFMLLCIVTLGSVAFAQEIYASSSNPTADRIATDLVGVKYSETTTDGYFKKNEMTFAEDGNLQVVINDCNAYGSELVYDVTVEFTTPTRGCYYVKGEVTYYRSGGEWKFDMFLCRSIMPKITNRYSDCISAKLVNDFGVNALVLKNHSNVKLGVYLVLYSGYKGEKVTKVAVSVDANKERRIGGMLSVDVEDYEIHYIERY